MAATDLQNLSVDARPAMTWRIGVTGHRDLTEVGTDTVEREIRRAFDDIEAALQAVHKKSTARRAFLPCAPIVALVSPLALGADRMCAELAAQRNFELRVPLPLAKSEYEKDFPATVADFDRLIAHARQNGGVVELAGQPEPADARNEAYMGVGEFVVRNCDLLLALWNEKPAAGHGGTGEVVARALKYGVPVLHIKCVKKAEDERLTWRLFKPEAEAWIDYTPDDLKQLIASRIIPQVRTRPKRRWWQLLPPDRSAHPDTMQDAALGAAERYMTAEPLEDTKAEPDYLYAGPYRVRPSWFTGLLSGLFPLFVRRLGGRGTDVEGAVRSDPPCGRADLAARYLFLHHHRADQLATFYSNVHRSAFLLVYALGAAALIFAVLALEFHDAMCLFTGLELAVLLALGALVSLDNWFYWRDRWLDYRLLAELLREADLLAQIGRPMPIAKIEELAQDLPRRAWVIVVYLAIVRRSPLASVKCNAAFFEKVRDYAADTRLQDQIAYHLKTEERAEWISSILRLVGRITFGATIVVAAWKLTGGPDYLGVFAGALPAIAYACFGIRNQAEFEIVSRRSERMTARLRRHRARIKALTGAKLTNDALGQEILDAAAVMRHDAADWASIFEVKETEAG